MRPVITWEKTLTGLQAGSSGTAAATDASTTEVSLSVAGSDSNTHPAA